MENKNNVIYKILSYIPTIAVQIVCIITMFISQGSAIETLNGGGVETLLSLLFIAPIFLVPLFINCITSATLLIASLISKQKWLLLIQLVVLAFTIYFSISFFSQVSLA